MQLENDLSIIYKIYVEKIQNQTYLQNRLQNFQKYEEISQNSLKGIIERNEERGNKILSDGVEMQASEPIYDPEPGVEVGSDMLPFDGEEEEEERF